MPALLAIGALCLGAAGARPRLCRSALAILLAGPDHRGARHAAGLPGVPPARPLCLDRDAGASARSSALVILNWESLTRGPIGVSGIPPLSLFGIDARQRRASVYWFTLAVLVVLALLQWRLLRSHLGRTLRAMRDDDVAARSYGISLDRYKALAFAFGGFAAGISGAHHRASVLLHQPRDLQRRRSRSWR